LEPNSEVAIPKSCGTGSTCEVAIYNSLSGAIACCQTGVGCQFIDSCIPAADYSTSCATDDACRQDTNIIKWFVTPSLLHSIISSSRSTGLHLVPNPQPSTVSATLSPNGAHPVTNATPSQCQLSTSSKPHPPSSPTAALGPLSTTTAPALLQPIQSHQRLTLPRLQAPPLLPLRRQPQQHTRQNPPPSARLWEVWWVEWSLLALQSPGLSSICVRKSRDRG
jgi:hypothetical protein